MLSGPAAAGRVCATALVKAKPDAVCPEGKDADVGIGTLRTVGTPAESRSGRPRRAAALRAVLMTAESTTSATSPARAARRPALPPATAIAPPMASHSRDQLAAADRRRIGRSSVGVRLPAMA